MATGKRYYWIKLKDTFMTSDAVDFLMGQPDGANYVVLYQMLCLKTINTGGRLERHIGEVIIPYDEAKIQRDCKWFSIDTVRVALNLYKALGLVYTDNDGALCLTDHENLVGSETDYAEKNRRMRANQQALLGGHNVSSDVSENVSIEKDKDIRDKDKEIRDKEKKIKSEEKEKEKEKEKTEKADAFAELANGDDNLLQALRDFNDMRTRIKHPLSDRAKTLLVNKLKTFPREDWVAILDQSIFYSWQGIFPLKSEDGKKSNKRTKSEYTASIDDDDDLSRLVHLLGMEGEKEK